MSSVPLPIQITSPQIWNNYAARYDVEKSNIFQLQCYNSASKIGIPQYLALRAIWSFDAPTKFKAHECGIQAVEKARGLLRKLPFWKEFLQTVSKHVPVDKVLPVNHAIGDFKLIWYGQQLIYWGQSTKDNEGNLDFSPPRAKPKTRAGVIPEGDDEDPFTQSPQHTRVGSLMERFQEFRIDDCLPDKQIATPSREEWIEQEPETPADDIDGDPDYVPEDDLDMEPETFDPVSDENVVNSYFVNFANAVTISIKGMKAHWTQERKAFIVCDKGKRKIYEARTDGHLSLPDGNHSLAIIEVKPAFRATIPRVMMQETAQMAAWINNEPDIDIDTSPKDKRFRHLLFSQNRHEIFLIVAEYDAGYIDYIRDPDGRPESRSFLMMKQFGPWRITNADDVMQIGSIILAVTLQLADGIPLA
ncbi:hypothetical protein BDV25DRAFT_135371 [Aspergillus avenaceus]|uniref:Uncharacterized protein n=1 Tax=Aspergillus avenaceus TaxID=36643 RepID=A0A5N6U8T0_ASPAV|nr:hypothetical protein BDV25DRAFT_135371 [Aspergillus avenaceus]